MEVLADEKEKLELSLCSEIAKKMKDKSLRKRILTRFLNCLRRSAIQKIILLFELKGYSESFQFVFEDYSYGIILKTEM